jgi:hypothetical protein
MPCQAHKRPAAAEHSQRDQHPRGPPFPSSKILHATVCELAQLRRRLLAGTDRALVELTRGKSLADSPPHPAAVWLTPAATLEVAA